jgi:hypothetical protein
MTAEARKAVWNRDYYERNREYILTQQAKRRRRLNALPAPRSGDAWTPVEDAIALRTDLLRIEVACMLQRSVNAVAGRRARLRRYAAAQPTWEPK